MFTQKFDTTTKRRSPCIAPYIVSSVQYWTEPAGVIATV